MTATYQLADDNSFRGVFQDNGDRFAGIYRLHVMDSGNFRPLPRLLGTDPRGTLYIGASTNVPERLGDLRKSIGAAYRQISPDRYASLGWMDVSTHQTSKKIVRIQRFVDVFAYDSLAVTVQPLASDDPELVEMTRGYFELETRLLCCYETEYGEKPALNG